jgi:hypothetical protein
MFRHRQLRHTPPAGQLSIAAGCAPEAWPALKQLSETANVIVNDAISTPLIIGAGGHFCPVARYGGAAGADEPAIAAKKSNSK